MRRIDHRQADPASPNPPAAGPGPMPPAPAAAKSACHARLALQFADQRGTTRLVGNQHFGPLRVQKALYPEAAAVCHAIIVHPPGGVVGGDQLEIRADVGENAHALLTTPGATKWYRANGGVSQQRTVLKAAGRATLEWLPQETIFFNRAQVELETDIELASGAQYIGCETLCFGRTASGESFDNGRISQRLSIRLAGRLVWHEQGVLAGDGPGMQSVLTLAGNTVCATLVAVATALPAGLLATLREQLAQEFHPRQHDGTATAGQVAGAGPGDGGAAAADPAAAALPAGPQFALTYMKPVLVARYLGHSGETARQIMTRVWQLLRPAMLGRDAVIPRIWNT